MKKIAFVVQRYGEEVTGGAEAECRMYAERLTDRFEVEALTTCAIDHLTWADHYAPGVSTLNGVTVRRFPVPFPRNLPEFFKLSTPLMDGSDLSIPAQQRWLQAMGPNCPGLLDYIRDHSEEYAAVLFMTYLYPTALEGIQLCKAPKLLIPTAHDEWALYLSSYRDLFEAADGYIYNSEAEHRLVDSVFLETCGKPTVTVGAGVQMPETALPDVRERFGLTKPYLCYCGRIESAKGCEDMFHFFSIYKRRFGGELDMVLTGQSAMVIPGRDDVHYLGFVSEEEKLAVMQGAVCLVQGSRFESLSIVVLESLMMGTPVLVNGQCPVLRDHVRLSGAGLYYGSADEFCGAVAWLQANPEKRALMGANGREYVAKNYHWPELIERLRGIIDEVSGGPSPEA